MEILNIRELTVGHLVNGHITVLPTDAENALVEEWKANGREVMPQHTDVELLQQAKASKLLQIEKDFILAESQAVEVAEITYQGGRDSVESIDSFVRLNRLDAKITHSIWDYQGAETVLTDAEADAVIIAIGTQSSVNKFTKKNRKVAVAVATTVIAVEAI